MNAIETSSLCKQYGNKNVVDNLDIQVPQGAIYGFIGRNGAGKSTTQKMVCGLANATSGNIRIFGESVHASIARSKVGTLIEQPGLYPGMTALENVILQGCNIGIENPKKQALKALETVGLSKAMKKKSKYLSLGMKQRLGLAIAMLGSPELLVLDEPINGLDPEGIVQLREIISDLHQKQGVTIFISSHILGELSKIATHYGIIKDGRLVEQTTAEELEYKRKDYLIVKVEDAENAVKLLKQEMEIQSFQVVSPVELHLLDCKDTAKVNWILNHNQFHVIEVFLHQQDLEEYFIELMGGSDYE